LALRKTHRILSSISLFGVLACPWSAPPGSFHQAIVRAKRSGDATVRLRITDRAWTTAYFFGPYTSNAEIDKVVGFNCDTCHLIELERRDDLNAIVLVSGKELVQVQELPRSAADIRPNLLKRSYPPDTVFNLARDSTGRFWLESVRS
jgi:hypothetical protein